MSRQIYVFGSNGEGQLGIPAADIVDKPVKVSNPPPLENLCAIVGGDNHTLFLTKDGQIWGSGDNRKGQLGTIPGPQTQRLESFTALHSNISFAAATCESSAYILTPPTNPSTNPPQATLLTQGSGKWSELGRSPETPPNNDVAFLCPAPVTAFAAGVWHYIALLTDGTVYGWGKARLGQLGPLSTTQVSIPTPIPAIPFKPVRVTCGKDFTYLVSAPSVGAHMVLGRDKFGIDSQKPAHVKGWKDVGASWHAIFVLFEDGRLEAWGRETMWRLVPEGLPLLDRIAVGSEHVLAVTREGALVSWGWGKHGNCGDLKGVKGRVVNDMVDGVWNEIALEDKAEVEMIAAGYCTSFVVTK